SHAMTKRLTIEVSSARDRVQEPRCLQTDLGSRRRLQQGPLLRAVSTTVTNAAQTEQRVRRPRRIRPQRRTMNLLAQQRRNRTAFLATRRNGGEGRNCVPCYRPLRMR